LVEESEESSFKELLSSKVFWILFVMMLCAGASEIAVSQWASAFAEAGLGVAKWIGDLIGPCLFAVCMGSARIFYAKKADKINLENGILVSSLICIGAYITIVFSPIAIISLIGCAVCGIGCGMLWPGSFSVAMKRIPKGGVPLFGLLAFAGDMGCLSGPVIAGFISDAFGGELKAGFLFSMIFPIILALMVLLLKKHFKKNGK
jgi:MFS family permease